MNNSRLNAAGSSAWMNQLVAALAICAVALSLLLGATPSQAQTVEKDGENVSAIRNLEIGCLFSKFIRDV